MFFYASEMLAEITTANLKFYWFDVFALHNAPKIGYIAAYTIVQNIKAYFCIESLKQF